MHDQSLDKAFRVIWAAFFTLLIGILPAWPQGALLPNARQQFIDQNGNPLTNGRVYMYVPNTTIPKTTWQNSGQTILNTNPIQLDAGGYATIYGQGSYQQRVLKQDNTLLWDAPTTAWNSAAPTGATGTDTAPVGAVMQWSGFTVPTNWAWANGQSLNRVTYSDLLDATTISHDSASCTSGSTTVGGWPDTSQIAVGSPIEAVCIPTGTTVTAILSASTISVSNAATATQITTARVFPYGNGDGVNTFNVVDMRGRKSTGADCLGGGSCANRLRVATTISTTIGSLTATVASVSGINLNMVIVSTNIPVGSTVTALTGTTVGLSNAATATASGTSVVFKIGAGVDAPGATGGAVNSAIVQNNIPQVNWPLSDPGHDHAAPFGQSFATSSSGNQIAGGSAYAFQPNTEVDTTGIVVSSGGNGTPLAVYDPYVTTNFIVKIKSNTTGAGGVVSINGMFGDIICDETFRCEALGSPAVNTIGLRTQADQTMLANVSGGATQATPTTLTQWLDSTCGATQGSLLMRGSSTWGCLTPGTSGFALISQGPGADLTWLATTGIGTVTSVGLGMPNIFSVTGSPVTGAGTLTATLVPQSANTVFAGPVSGGAAIPTFRALTPTDVSAIAVTTFNGAVGDVTGVGSFNGRTGSVSPATDDYTQCQITPNGVYNVKCYGALGDWQQAADGSVSAASCNFTTSSPHFSAADVNKGIQIAGAGAAGVLLTTTVAAYVSPTALTLTDCASTTVGPTATYEWYTNDTTSIQNAITAARGAGYVLLPCGRYAITGLNATQWTGGKIQGAGGGYGCAILEPIGSVNAMVDMTGSPSFELRNLQVGTAVDLGMSIVGIITGPSATTPGIDTVRWDHVHVSGRFSVAACYRDRIASSYFVENQCWNYQQTAGAAAVVFTDNNVNGFSSSFTTTLTGATVMNITDLTMEQEEAHGYIAAGKSVNNPININGAFLLRWIGGNVDSSNTSMIIVTNGGSGTIPSYLTFVGTQFYTENGTLPTNIFGGTAGAMTNIYLMNAWRQAAFTVCANTGGCTVGVVLP